MGLQLLEGPSEQPVSVAVAKQHLRIAPGDTFQDDEVARIIRAATARAERITQRALLTQRWCLYLDGFPPGAIRIPRPPLKSVESIFYTDASGQERELDTETYLVNPFEILGQVTPMQGRCWPATAKQAMAVRVEFTAGYDAVPDDIVSAILLLVGHLDQNREEVVTGTIATKLPAGAEALLSPYEVPGVP